MIDPEDLHEAILDKLSMVIDPETGIDVVRMRLIEDLTVDENGRVSYKFRPSSPLCPIAVPLSLMIQKAVAEVEGVSGQEFQIVGYLRAEELTRWIREALAGQDKGAKDPSPRKD
jgi:metal-sulfur cluster biosynthetic enzyme